MIGFAPSVFILAWLSVARVTRHRYPEQRLPASCYGRIAPWLLWLVGQIGTFISHRLLNYLRTCGEWARYEVLTKGKYSLKLQREGAGRRASHKDVVIRNPKESFRTRMVYKHLKEHKEMNGREHLMCLSNLFYFCVRIGSLIYEEEP